MPASIRILIVEDDPQDAALAEREVRKADVFCTFRRVDTREGMAAALRDYAPDVILTDHSLPNFTARDALSLAQQLSPGTPVIVVTGMLGDEPAVQYLQLGAADYILKDHLHRLGPAVLRALDTKRSREEQARAHQLQAATFRIAQAAIATPGLQMLLPVIHQIVAELMPAKNLYIALYDAATDLLSFPYAVDEHDTDVAPRRPGKGLTEYVLRTGEPLLVTPEVQAALEAQGQVELVGAPSIDWLGVPLKVGDRTIGVLAVQTYTPGVRYDKREKELLQFVSSQVALAIERSRAEEESRASAARLNAIIDAALDAVITMDGSGVIRSWSPQAERMFGWPAPEAIGRKLSATIIPPQHRAAHERGLARFLAPGEGRVLNRRIEITGLHRDGREIPVELAITPVRIGEAWLFSAFVRDTTERRRAEEALRNSELTYRSLVEDSPFGIFRSTPDGRILAVNPALVGMLGYPSEAELQQRTMSDIYVDQAERRRLIDLVTQAGSLTAESVWRRADGRHITVRQTGRAVTDASGKVQYFNVLVEDMTEHRQLEERLRQAQKMEAIGRLAGGVAHDFNNVLTAIFGYADLVAEELPARAPARKDLAEIRKAAERAAALTKQLLAFSRQQMLQPRVLNLNELVEDVDKMLRRLIGEDIDLRLALTPGVGNVRVDPGQLQQVIMNLVVNARDAMPTGGKLLLETDNAELSEQYAEAHQPVVPGAYVLLAVSDTGIGMDTNTRARIFEPFFTTKEKGKGTGLGLSTVYGIVKQSGGYIWPYSEPGRGTTFKIYLPRVEGPAEGPVARGEGPRPSGGRETILLAEDDAILRPLTKGLLEKLGYQVLQAENAAQALAAARAHRAPIHLLVADVVMPGGSGRELAQQLAEIRPETRVLYVSGYTVDAIVHHGMLEPGLNFLQKPFNPDALARKVREVLDAPKGKS